MTKLTEKNYEIFARIGREIYERADRAVALYYKLLKQAEVPTDGYHESDDLNNGPADLEELEGGLSIHWSKYIGGNETKEGSNVIGTKMLMDDTWEEAVTYYANTIIKKRGGRIIAEQKQKENEERRQLANLKSKYE